ncbi:DUF4440 domain-containing protein [Aestuariibius sp. HNIBRBA575]|uniref:YybH family protein n=1 Tax=Aestuariibius sp. HNIBRBA575 TaxID=3233343 RepID=UPI0034A1A058
MKHAFAWLITLALISPQLSIAQGQTMTEDQQNVLSSTMGMAEAFQQGDIAGVMRHYEPEATVLFEPGAPVSNVAQLEQMFAEMSALGPQFSFSEGHDVIVNGDIAIHIAPWNMVAHLPDGQEITQSGLSVAVLRKQPDGQWKMVIDNPHGARLMSGS